MNLNPHIEKIVSKYLFGNSPVFMYAKFNELFSDVKCFFVRQKENIMMRDLIYMASTNPSKIKHTIVYCLLMLGYTAFYMSMVKLEGINSAIRVQDFKYIGKGIYNVLKYRDLNQFIETYSNEGLKEERILESYYVFRTGQSLNVLLIHLHYYGLISLECSIKWLKDNHFPFEIFVQDIEIQDNKPLLNFVIPSELSMIGSH